MEITCNRCHQTVSTENSYCPSCGLPQLQYAADAPAGQDQPEHWDKSVRDAATITWKPALRAALLLAIPAGVLCSGVSPVGFGGIIWMAAAAAWAVVLYVRSQRAAWITAGAGARIGLVTGIFAGWLGFGLSGCTLFVERVVFHHAAEMDAAWKTQVDAVSKMTEQWMAGMGTSDAAQVHANQVGMHAWMLTPWGQAGYVVASLAIYAAFLLLLAAAGGALGARMMIRSRRTQA